MELRTREELELLESIEIMIGPRRWAIIDKEDYDRVMEFSHYWNGKGYVSSSTRDDEGVKRTILLHRFIMNAKDDEQVDHWDHNKRNCRKSNLRRCSPSQNQGNRGNSGGVSKYKGVSYRKHIKKWTAFIATGNGKRTLGVFVEEKDAAIAYDKAAREYFGEFAWVNFPLEGETNNKTIKQFNN